MALRHLTLNDPQYVPQYNTLDSNLVAGVAGSIQQQGAQAEQYRINQMDTFRDTIDTTLGNLPEEDRMYAQNVVSEIQGGIDDYVAKHGSRRSTNFVGKQAQQFQDRLRPHFNYAGTQTNVLEKLEESEAPSMFKNAIDVGQIKYDEEGNASYSGMDIENKRRLNIVSNYKDPYEKLKEFNSKSRRASGTEDYMFTPVTDSRGNVIVDSEGNPTNEYRTKLKSIGFDSIMQDNMAVLLADPQIREQLTLKGQLELEAAEEQGLETNVSIGDDGSVSTIVEVPKMSVDKEHYIDKDGNPVSDAADAALEEKEVEFDSVAHWKAADEARPFAMRDAFIDRSFDVRRGSAGKGRGTDPIYSGNFRLSSNVDYEIEQQSVKDYFKSHVEEKQQIQKSNETLTNRITEDIQSELNDARVNVSSSDEGHTLLHINGQKFDIRKPEDRQELQNTLGESFNLIDTQLQDISNNYRKAKHLDRTEDEIMGYIKNNLSGDSENGELLDYIFIGDNGKIELNQDKIQEAVEKGEIEGEYLGSNRFNKQAAQILQSRLGIEAEQVRGMEDSQFTRLIMNQSPENVPVSFPDGVRELGRLQGKTVVKRDGRFYTYDEASSGEMTKLNNAFNRAKELQQEAIDRYREVGTYEVDGVVLNYEDDIDKEIIESIKRLSPGRPGASGEVADRTIIGGDGNPIDIDYTAGEYFEPVELANIRGEASVIGVVKDADKNIVEGKENVRFTGEASDSVLQRVLGNNYRDVLGIQQLSSYLHRPVQGERNNSLSVNQLARIHGLTDESIPFKDGLNVDYRVSYDQDGNRKKRFYVKEPGKDRNIIVAETYQELYNGLENRINEQL